MTYLIEQVRARCARVELPLPDRRTIKARVDRIDRRVAALKRKDSKGVKATKAIPGQYVASRPLETVQIDHTEVDLFLVDETTREAMSVRPWLTLASDVAPAWWSGSICRWIGRPGYLLGKREVFFFGAGAALFDADGCGALPKAAVVPPVKLNHSA